MRAQIMYVLLLVAMLPAVSAFGAQEVYADGVRIVATTPDALVEDREQEVEVTVDYELVSRDQGRVYIGFNTDGPKNFTLASDTAVRKGKGRVVLRVKVVPKYWGQLTFFQAFANLSEDPHPDKWAPLAVDTAPIEIKRKG